MPENLFVARLLSLSKGTFEMQGCLFQMHITGRCEEKSALPKAGGLDNTEKNT
jgi:hypothetical protein